MVFSSPRFFAFLLVTFLFLALCRSVARKKDALALLSSFFYAAWDWRYLFLLLAISVIDYVAAACIARSPHPRARKRWLIASIASNLGFLAYFKYTNFFIDNWNGLLPLHALPNANILLPAGISFYTFKSLSYTIDVYRGHILPCRSHRDYVTFITFFPELIAGPIVRASVLLPQLDRDVGLTREGLRVGGSLFLVGLGKKIMIADRLAPGVDAFFAEPQRFDQPSAWCALLAYTMQVYCDFSGYSDMAIGTAKMIGYDLPENFDRPFTSRSVTELWRRWHITLNAWLRDYVFTPLGGSKHGPLRMTLNIFITMLLGGLWHGPSWTFVVWGGIHGSALALHRFIRRRSKYELPAFIAIPGTFFLFLIGSVPFRAQTLHAARLIARNLLVAPSSGIRFYPIALVWIVPLVAVGHALCEPAVRSRLSGLLARADVIWREDKVSGGWFVFGGRGVLGAFTVTTFVLVLFFFAAGQTKAFIYFQF